MPGITNTIQLIDGQLVEVPTVVIGGSDSVVGAIPALNEKGVLDPSIMNQTDVSLGPGSAGRGVALNSRGQIDASMLPLLDHQATVGVGSEELGAGAWVHYDETSDKWTNASAQGRPCDGFVLEASAPGANIKVYTSGNNTGLKDQKPGPVFLQTAAGQGSRQPVRGKGLYNQQLGRAINSTTVIFSPGPVVRLAS